MSPIRLIRHSIINLRNTERVYPQPIQNLINVFAKFPGIGPRQAARMVFYLLGETKALRAGMANAVMDIAELVVTCVRCGNIEAKQNARDHICSICADTQRDQTRIAIVEHAADVRAMERARTWRGLYHVLGGAISTSTEADKDVARFNRCIERITAEKPEEVIIATNPTFEGDAAARYLTQKLTPSKITVTRLARGLSRGVDLEYVDDETLREALAGRR